MENVQVFILFLFFTVVVKTHEWVTMIYKCMILCKNNGHFYDDTNSNTSVVAIMVANDSKNCVAVK